MKKILAMAAMLAAWCAGGACGYGQVIGVVPTPMGMYQWNSTSAQWNKATNSYAAYPLQNTPQAFAFYGWNAALGMWTPCDTVTESCPGIGGMTTINVNGIPTTPISPVNLNSTSPAAPTGYQNVMWQQDGSADVSAYVAGVSQAIQVSAPPPPIGGRYAILLPSGCSIATTGTPGHGLCSQPIAYLGSNVTPSANIWIDSTVGSLNPGYATANFQFTLPSFISQANVTAVYAFAATSKLGGSDVIGWPSCSSTLPSAQGPFYIAPFPTGSAATNWALQQVTASPWGTVPTVSSITCTGEIGATYANGQGQMVVSPGLLVYYTGSAPPTNNSVQVAPPMFYTPGTPGLISLSLPFDLAQDISNTNSYSATVASYVNALNPSLILPPLVGATVKLLVSHGNTSTAPTLAINGGSAYTIVGPRGGAIALGDISSSYPALLVFDGTNWDLQNPQVAGAGAVTSVSNSDGTLTFSPTTGAVVASLNLGHANTWTATQTLPSPVFTGTADASGAAQFKLPIAAGFASAAQGEVGYDSANKNWHLWQNGADKLLVPLASGFVSGDCPEPTSSAGAWTLADAGAPCGTGSGGVTSLNSLTGALSITAGANITVTPAGSNIQISSSGGGGTVLCTPNAQTGTSYTLVLADGVASGAACIGTVTMNNASINTVTVPPNSSVAFPTPDEIDLIQLGAGQTCFAAGAGVTLTTPTSLCARAQKSTIGIRQIAANTWIVFGDTQ